jgi:hypothetical protein
MVTQQAYRELALALPGVEEAPHFDKQAFKHKNRIFSTLWEKENRVMLKLSLPDQAAFGTFDSRVCYPVPNVWGKQGSTFFELNLVNPDMLTDALNCAYLHLVNKVNKK